MRGPDGWTDDGFCRAGAWRVESPDGYAAFMSMRGERTVMVSRGVPFLSTFVALRAGRRSEALGEIAV